MDFILRCNSLKCRTQLSERAVVTTCSHIFCLACAESTGLASAANSQRTCPACGTGLTNPDDVVSTQLNPTEDYKTSVLSGLSPALITECAGRALAFWSYQSSQEIIYQEFLAKSLTDKYGTLNVQLDKVINDANSEIENLSQRLAGMQVEHDRLRTENHNILTTLRERTRKQQQTQELYDRLKRKQMAVMAQSAALEGADEMLFGAQTSNGSPPLYPPGLYSASQRPEQPANLGMRPPPPRPFNRQAQEAAPAHTFGGQDTRTQTDFLNTPHHRQRLGSSIPVPTATFQRTSYHNSPGATQANFQRQSGMTNGFGVRQSRANPGLSLSGGMKQGIPQTSRSVHYGNNVGKQF